MRKILTTRKSMRKVRNERIGVSQESQIRHFLIHKFTDDGRLRFITTFQKHASRQHYFHDGLKDLQLFLDEFL